MILSCHLHVGSLGSSGHQSSIHPSLRSVYHLEDFRKRVGPSSYQRMLPVLPQARGWPPFPSSRLDGKLCSWATEKHNIAHAWTCRPFHKHHTPTKPDETYKHRRNGLNTKHKWYTIYLHVALKLTKIDCVLCHKHVSLAQSLKLLYLLKPLNIQDVVVAKDTLKCTPVRERDVRCLDFSTRLPLGASVVLRSIGRKLGLDVIRSAKGTKNLLHLLEMEVDAVCDIVLMTSEGRHVLLIEVILGDFTS